MKILLISILYQLVISKIIVSDEIVAYVRDIQQDKTKTLYICTEKEQLTILQNIQDKSKCICMATFHDTIDSQGWDKLYMEILQDTPLSYYAIGFLEGMLTFQKTEYFLKTYIAASNFNIVDFDPELINSTNYQYHNLRETIDLVQKFEQKLQKDLQKNKKDPMFQEFMKIKQQFTGILDGYNSVNPKYRMTEGLLNIINYGGAIDNLLSFTSQNQKYRKMFRLLKRKHLGQDLQKFIKKTLRGRCTVLIKYLQDQVYLSHTTMDNYTAMQRIYKYLKTPQREMQYSSYPCTISSTDDFFLINKNLMVTETSLSFSPGSEQLKDMLKSNYIPEYYKVVASARISNTAQDWISNMSRFKGGIYNSQWIVFDADAFEKRTESQFISSDQVKSAKELEKEFLLVFEDEFYFQKIFPRSKKLLEDGYFSGFNTQMQDAFYFQNNRHAKIREMHNSISDINSLIKVMGHNEQLNLDFRKKRSKEILEKELKNTIMFRFDKIDQTLISGGIDIKVTDMNLIRNNECFARNGPAGLYNFFFKVPGLPQKWDFKFQTMNQQTISQEFN